MHLDDNANYLGRELLDKLIGNENFRNEIIWQYKSSAPPKRDFQRNHQSILRYSKSEKYIFNTQYDSYSASTLKRFDKIDKNGKRYKIVTKKDKQFIVYMKEEGTPADDVWYFQIIVGGSLEDRGFNNTQKPEKLLKRIILSSSNESNIIFDFFAGSGTTIATAHKLNRKWIGVEMGDHFEKVIIPRMKEVLAGKSNREPCGISKDVNWQGGGFFKYYKLEQFEDILKNACYRPLSDEPENIDFKINEKLAEKGLNLDYDKEKSFFTFEHIYNNIDVMETISNTSGWKIKKIINKKEIVFFDELTNKEIKIDLNDLTYEKYPFLKNLIWW